MEFKVLGPVAVTGDSGPLELGGAKPRLVLAVLLANQDRWVSMDRLIDEVWGDDPPTSVVNTLQSYLSRLRRGLGANRLVSGRAGYRLVAEGTVCDAVEFERLVGETVGEQDSVARRGLLVEALALWRGDPYQDVADTPTIVAERIRLLERRLVTVERRVTADLDLGEHQRLISELERLVDQHPLREGLWGQLMLASYRSGRQADALAAYRRLRHLLAQELGIEPGPEIRRLEEQILLQDPALDLVDLGSAPSQSVSPGPVSGTVTFLFTDIEQSTRLWEEQPDQMAAALAQHDRILTSIIESAGGYLFSSAGDSHAAAFRRASQALHAAIAGQLALQNVTVDGLPLPVRMAVHTGEALERDGDYFGPVLNRAGRLRDSAHGGQILLSHAVEELVGDELPGQVSLLDLGEHRLRDLTRPERIYQLTHPELPATYPPLHTLDANNNLPIQLTSFVGRDQEVAEVHQLLRSSRLVTLTGAGGCGKTRLAIEAAASLLEQFPDGVWFVDLAPLTDPELVIGTTTRSLGLTEPRSRRSLDVLVEFIRTRTALMVLDNCEHLLEAVTQLTTKLIRAAPQLRVLATTRQPLGLKGESIWPVPPLRIPAEDTPIDELQDFESVRLFQERAMSARPGFRITDANGEAVRRICRRLDGIPLALELVTALLRVLSTAMIADRLEISFTVLGSAGSDGPPHQRTLEATLDWSFDLLTQEEQKLLIRISVFAGGWTLEAAEQVCSGDGIDIAEVLELIFGLADKSMVVVGDGLLGTRYRLLEPLRQYASKKLVESGEEADFRRRHAEHFARLAEEAFYQLIGPEEVQWLDRLEDEVDNLRAALAWHLETGETQQGQLMAGALYRFFGRSLRDLENRNWLQRMLDADQTQSQPRARALLGLSTVSGVTVLERASLLDEALELYRRFGPEYELETARNNRGVWASAMGDWQLAANLHGEGLDLARQRGDDVYIAMVAANLSELKADWEGEFDAAAVLAEEAARAARKFGSAFAIHTALRSLAKVARCRGDFPAAIAALKEALEIERRPGARIWNVGEALLGLAEVAYQTGSLDEALDYLAQHHEQIHVLGYGEPEARRLTGTSSLLLRVKIEFARRNHFRAVVLMAAVATSHTDEVLPPSDEKRFNEALTQGRRELGEEAFSQAWSEGAAMTLSQALDYALQHSDP